jgi:transcriptional regulator with XRE-family HTH domain
MAKGSNTKPGMPFADTPIAQYLSKQIDIQVSMGKKQRQIAQEIGYDKPNMISMFKRGEAKVPLDKIPLLARSLSVDPAFLFRLAMQQYWPNERETIVSIFGDILTKDERHLVEMFRRATKDLELAPNPALERKIKEWVKDEK